jgi:hypothetical protein
MTLEVRSATGDILLGWLPAPRNARPGVRDFLVGPSPLNWPDPTIVVRPVERLSVPIVAATTRAARTHLVYRVAESALESLRRIPGFVEHVAAAAEL